MNPMGAGAASDDADLNAIMVPKTAKLGGGALLLLGVLTLVLFLQTVLQADQGVDFDFLRSAHIRGTTPGQR